MKAIITKIKAKNNAQITAEVEIRDNDGKVIYKGNRGFVCLGTTVQEILSYLKTSLKNIGSQEKAEKASKLKDKAVSLEGQEIDLDT